MYSNGTSHRAGVVLPHSACSQGTQAMPVLAQREGKREGEKESDTF